MRKGKARSTGEDRWHLLGEQAQSHKKVVRSTFGDDFFAVTAAADQIIPLLVNIEEMAYGPRSLAEAKRLREEGRWAFKNFLCTDAMSFFSSCYYNEI